jgi:hypothetical protein
MGSRIFYATCNDFNLSGFHLNSLLTVPGHGTFRRHLVSSAGQHPAGQRGKLFPPHFRAVALKNV